MNKVMNIAIISIFSIGTHLAFAHGEDKPGPNKGFIRMPGAFHTELVPDGKNKLQVYLLDMEWKNPSVERSNLQIRYNDRIDADCKIQRNFYVCKFPKSVDLSKKGELKVNAQRNGQTGMEVSYPLPLKLQKVDDGHGGHH